MSKYVEFWPLVIMKTSIFFIVLFIFNQSVNCNHTDSSVTPSNIARPKRAFEYTRWKMLDEDTDKQFVVKVLDEELSANESEDNLKNVVGVNYAAHTRSPENMIVGGVVDPPGHTPAEPAASLNEYIRFLPPHKPGETSYELTGENDTLPIPMDQWELSPKIPMLYPEQEQNPPASPQFVPRQHMQPQQYVPVNSISSQKTSVASTEDSSEEIKPNKIVPFTRMTKPLRTFNRIPSRILHVTRTESRKFKPLKQNEQYLKENRKSTGKSSLLDINYFELLHKGKVTLLEESTTIMSQYSKDKDEDYNGDTKKENSDNIADTNKILLSLDYNYETNEKESLGLDIDDNKVVQENRESKRSDMNSLTLGVDYEDEIVDYNEKNHTGVKNEILKSVTTVPAGYKRTTKSVEFCNILNIRPLIFNDTLTLPEIMSTLKSWSENSPITKMLDITNGNLTTMENPIPLMIVDDPSGGQTLSAKRTIMIVAGIVGQDHYSVAATMYILHQLIDGSIYQNLLNSYRFWIIPVLNPDGYDYSKSFPQYRHWQKNLRQNWEYCKKNDKTELESCKSCEMNGLRCFVQPCYGVNLDRNFEYQWLPGQETETENPCSDLYSGPQQLSEVESFALTKYLHESPVHIDIFFAIKEGDVLGIMYPYSHTKKKRTRENYFKSKAQSAAQAISQLTGRVYQAGQTSQFLKLYAGGIEDWVDGHLTLDGTYSIHMCPQKPDIYKKKFMNIPMEKLIQEPFVAIESILVHKTRKVLDIISLPGIITTTTTLRTKTTDKTIEKKKIVVVQESKSQANAPWIIAVVPSIVISLNYI